MLERVLAAGAGARMTVVVGPRRPLPAPVRWTREDPPGSGPLAALAAGLSLCEAPVTVVLAADMPMLDEAVVAALVEAASADDVDGAVLTDDTGHQQPLAAAYRRDALRDALTRIGDPRDRPVRLLLSALRLATVPNSRAALDCDTPDDLVHADRLAERRPPPT
jgi:molybdopterin-guanine dinucleotide biosynthesis protein A